MRGKGSIWIIETLWDIDFKLYDNHLPDIDKASKAFLMKLAAKDYEH
jgi:hypothetical protein